MTKDKRQGGNGGVPSQGREAGQHDAVGFDAQLEQEFLTASKQAIQIHASQQASVSRTRSTRLVWASAVVAVVMIVMVSVGMLRNGTQVPGIIGVAEADEFRGVEGTVISCYTRRPVSGIAIYEIDPGMGKHIRLAGITAGQGTFSIAPDEAGVNRLFELEFEGNKVGTIKVGIEGHLVRGYQLIEVNVPQDDHQRVEQVSIAPGNKVTVMGLSLSLAADAGQNWSGSVTVDSDWPAFFNYGTVVDGIFSVQGKPNPHLSLTIDVPSDRLRFYNARQDDLRIAAYSNKYEHDNELSYEEQCQASIRHGWYWIGAPPAEYLPLPVSVDIEETEFGCSVGWFPEVDRPYILLRTPEADGELVALFHSRLPSGPGQNFEMAEELNYKKMLSLEGLKRNQLSIFELFYSANLLTPLNPQPLLLPFSIDLEVDHERRDGGTPWEALSEPGVVDEIPGGFELRRYDFTLSSYASYDLGNVSFNRFPAEFSIAVDQGAIGEITRFHLVGDQSGLAESPAWDFYDDRIVDAQGSSCEILVPTASVFDVSVVLHEKSGAISKLVKRLHYASENVIGFFSKSAPITRGKTTASQEEASFVAMTRGMVANSASCTYTAGSYIGPAVLIDPPSAYRETELEKLRIVLYGSALSDQCGSVYLVPDVRVLTDDDATSIQPLSSIVPTGNVDLLFNDFGYGNLSLYVMAALGYHQNGGSLRDFLESLTLEKHSSQYVIAMFRVGIGLDLTDLQDETIVLEQLQEFRNSPFYSERRITGQRQKVEWVVDLHGAKLPAQGDLVTALHIETRGRLVNAQWELLSGAETPSRVELYASGVDEPHVTYLDLSQLE